MSDKPEMYKNRINKEFNNNKLIYTSYDKEKNILNDIDIRKKIDDIINSNNFIYSKVVNIMIGNSIHKKRIIGLYNNNLVTIDNEYIPLDDIKDIYI